MNTWKIHPSQYIGWCRGCGRAFFLHPEKKQPVRLFTPDYLVATRELVEHLDAAHKWDDPWYVKLFSLRNKVRDLTTPRGEAAEKETNDD